MIKKTFFAIYNNRGIVTGLDKAGNRSAYVFKSQKHAEKLAEAHTKKYKRVCTVKKVTL